MSSLQAAGHRWSHAVARARWVVAGLWLAATVAGAIFGGQIFDRAASVPELGPNAESMRAEARLNQLVPEGEVVVAVVKDRPPYDPALVASVEAVTRALSGMAKVESLYNAPGGMIGRDAQSTVVRAELLHPEFRDRVVAELRKIDSPRVLVSGEALAEEEFAEQAIRDAAVGEGVAFLALTALLIWLFRRKSGYILATAVASIAVTLLVLLGLSQVTTVSEFALNVVTLLGLGLTVDYSLLLLWRQREEGAWWKAVPAVLISAAAVALSLLGMVLFAEPLLSAMALGGLAAVVVAAAAALTLTPALMAITARPSAAGSAAAPTVAVGEGGAGSESGGGRGGALRNGGARGKGVRGGDGDAWRSRILWAWLPPMAAYAMRRPKKVGFFSALAMIVLTIPFLGVDLANSDAGVLPQASEARQVHEEIKEVFRQGRPEPVTVVIEGDSGGLEMLDYLNRINGLAGVALVQQRLEIPEGTTVLDITPDSEQQATDVVRAVRAVPLDRPHLVGGPAAELVDYTDAVADRLPLVLLVLFLILLILLFVLTGSLLIPVKALVLNLLPLGAALGVLTLIFGELDVTTPVLLFVFIFGLSMDYEVFVLARITELYRASGKNDRAVLRGLTLTGPVVTAAAACLIVVFLGFVFAELSPVRQIGAGMAIALLLDVTLVRAMLLPATMKLLGKWNWWPTARSVSGHDPRR